MIDSQEKQIANKLKLIRTNSGISQKELAENLDVSIQTITQIESHKRAVSFPLLRSYALYFNLDISDILGNVFKKVSEESLNYIDEIDSIKDKLLSLLPVQIPTYSHRELFNPKFPKQKPLGFALRTGNYYSNNSKDLYMMQVQTNTVYPEILANDRVIVDKGIEVDNGIGIVFRKSFKRNHFNDEYGAMIVRFHKDENGNVLFSNNFIANHQNQPIQRELKKDEYKGMIVQIIRPVLVKGENRSYKNLPVEQV
tara:strand:+ start:1051 stop:1812 length:762 start_codon:yes stop_codon:yes gene_type:complete